MTNNEVIKKLVNINWDFSEETGGDGQFGLHPYPAKFIPHIPDFLMAILGVPKDTVILDPFCGSGTSLIKAQMHGYESIGIDLNPIATLISKVATNPQPSNLIETANCVIEKISKSKDIPLQKDIPNLDHWFKKPVQKAISAILAAIEEETNPNTRDILRLALSSTIVRVSNQDSDTRYAAVDKKVSYELVLNLFLKTVKKYSEVLPKDANLPMCQVYTSDVLEVNPDIFHKKVGLVITSPPYPNAYEYWLYHKYRMWWLGYDPLFVKEHEIGARAHFFKKNHHTSKNFEDQMAKVFQLLHKVCADEAFVCFVIGDSKIHGKIVDNTKILIDSATTAGFTFVASLPRVISLSRKAFNLTNSRLQSENIVIFRKEKVRDLSTFFELKWHKYGYLPYEKKFALRELAGNETLKSLYIKEDTVQVGLECNSTDHLDKLVYFKEYSSSDVSIPTLQARLENGKTNPEEMKRQSTRYSVHGLHEYKGKFNPQVVRSLINSATLKESSLILDPFCGSGTSLVEAAIGGFHSVGWDKNPFAIFLSNAKLLALRTDPSKLKIKADKILSSYKNLDNFCIQNNPRTEYLKSWFPEDILFTIEKLAFLINKHAKEYHGIFLTMVSDLLRDYSLQEPSDLRIRRRNSPFPSISFMDALEVAMNKKLNDIEKTFNIIHNIKSDSRAFLADGRDVESVHKNGLKDESVDMAITSPPYATALPYIDTQRLSLIWLNLLSPNQIREEEENLIGTREISKTTTQKFNDELRNDKSLPETVLSYCSNLLDALSESDGFRRRAVPALLYKYFKDMQLTFSTVHKLMKKNAKYMLIVGTNSTTLGGTKFEINTPEFLGTIAEYDGWKIKEYLALETYKRFSIHQENSVKDETLIILEK